MVYDEATLQAHISKRRRQAGTWYDGIWRSPYRYALAAVDLFAAENNLTWNDAFAQLRQDWPDDVRRDEALLDHFEHHQQPLTNAQRATIDAAKLQSEQVQAEQANDRRMSEILEYQRLRAENPFAAARYGQAHPHVYGLPEYEADIDDGGVE